MASITCITATAPGRESFLAQCRRFVDRFTLKPEAHIVVSSPDFRKNIKDALSQVKTGHVAFIEDDDWYAPNYLKDMLGRLEYSRRALIGYDPTLYYHIVRKGYMVLPHRGRASLYTTVGVTSIINLAYEKLYKKYNGRDFAIDLTLWAALSDVSVTTVGHLALGMKHGLVKSEGVSHHWPKSYWTEDTDNNYLKQLIGEEDTNGYSRIVKAFSEGEPGVLQQVP